MVQNIKIENVFLHMMHSDRWRLHVEAGELLLAAPPVQYLTHVDSSLYMWPELHFECNVITKRVPHNGWARKSLLVPGVELLTLWPNSAKLHVDA